MARKGIMTRTDPRDHRALKLIALQTERTLQDVMQEAISDCLTKYFGLAASHEVRDLLVKSAKHAGRL